MIETLEHRIRTKGVTWRRDERKWAAQIGINGKCVYLGLFRSEDAAARAYDAAARTAFGEYAALNFPNPGEQSALRCAARAHRLSRKESS